MGVDRLVDRSHVATSSTNEARNSHPQQHIGVLQFIQVFAGSEHWVFQSLQEELLRWVMSIAASALSVPLTKGNSDSDGIERLNCFLRKIMVRRTHADKLFDTSLLSLPAASDRTIPLDFNETERSIYELVRNRIVLKINGIAKHEGKAGLEKRYNHIWTMLLRLRQASLQISRSQARYVESLTSNFPAMRTYDPHSGGHA